MPTLLMVGLVALGAILGACGTLIWVNEARSQGRTLTRGSLEKLKVSAHRASISQQPTQTDRENRLLRELSTLVLGRMNRLDPITPDTRLLDTQQGWREFDDFSGSIVQLLKETYELSD